jgi:hypothetical protein
MGVPLWCFLFCLLLFRVCRDDWEGVTWMH